MIIAGSHVAKMPLKLRTENLPHLYEGFVSVYLGFFIPLVVTSFPRPRTMPTGNDSTMYFTHIPLILGRLIVVTVGVF